MERLEGLEDGEIPIEPAQQTYNNIEVEGGDRKRRHLKRAVLWCSGPVRGPPQSSLFRPHLPNRLHPQLLP